jgi:Cys-tRNA(Pro) deacylase
MTGNKHISLIPPVSRILSNREIPHKVFEHQGILDTLEQAAAERSQRPEQVVRSILFKIKDGDYLMVLMAGKKQIDWIKLRRLLGVSRMRLASRQEVIEVTGFTPGAVAPFGLPAPLRIIVDESVLNEVEISIGSGLRGVAVILKSTDLMNALGDAEITDLGKHVTS